MSFGKHDFARPEKTDRFLKHNINPGAGAADNTLIDIGGDRFFFAGAGRARTFFGPFRDLGLLRQADPPQLSATHGHLADSDAAIPVDDS